MICAVLNQCACGDCCNSGGLEHIQLGNELPKTEFYMLLRENKVDEVLDF